jgi:hypothetical protein
MRVALILGNDWCFERACRRGGPRSRLTRVETSGIPSLLHPAYRHGAGLPHEATDCQIGRDRRSRLDGFRMNNGIALSAARESEALTGTG